MTSFADSYVGKLRAEVGSRLLMVPGTRVFIEDDDGRLLLQHRRDFDLWGVPGGNVEPDETMEACIVREMEEEAGITIKSLIPFAFCSDPEEETVTFPNGDECRFFVMMFWTRDFDGTPRVTDPESLALEWFAPDDPPPLVPTMVRSFRLFRTWKETGTFQIG